jgi:hypothetical protein
LLGTLLYLAHNEQTSVRIWFTIAVTLSVAALVALVSRRLLFAGFAAALLIALISVLSDVLMGTMSKSLHAYDFFFYLNWPTVTFLWSEYRSYLVVAAITLAVVGVLAVLIWRFDKTRCPRIAAGLALAAAVAAAAWLTAPAYALRRPFQIFGPLHPISNFFLSWGETFRVLRDGRFIEASARTDLPAFAATPQCRVSGKPPPTIFLIHQESLMPPNLFPGLSYDHGLDPLFISDDQQQHRLRVETFGGASWLTDFSLLSGISSRSFGDMRPFLSVFMKNKLKSTLPQVLETCGFKNMLFFPMDENFLALGEFYKTVGLATIFDRAAQRAPSDRERDRFYFTNALAAMEQQFKSSDQPLFVYVQTMAAHGPYNFKYAATEAVPGGGPETPADMDEFLRRMAMAKIDYDFLIAELKRRFPDRPLLIVRYGDHQPAATRSYFNVPENFELNEETVPAAFVTYYAMAGLNYSVPPLPAHDPLDVAFLGTTMLEAAGIPLPDAYQERKRLMSICDGQYYGCKRGDEILSFHRRLINSGHIQEH